MLRDWVTYLTLLVFFVLLYQYRMGFIPFGVTLIPLAVATGISAWGASRVDSNYFIKTLCRADTKENAVALSFDDGPVSDYTPQILDILNKHGISAAFFCIGHRAAADPALLRRIYAEGHLIGNHSYSHHALFDLYPASKMKADLQKANETIENAIGETPKLFRPPYGVTNPMLAKAVKKFDFISVGWSIRSLDTVIKDEDELFARVTRNIKAGDIFLFHDTCAATVSILPALIKKLQREGFAIKRIDELLKIPAYA
ncbi:polysaccharide deacetylase family protein [Chitinophaga sp. GCM10012297]|uniref:Polysaccharide deacetylase family protein n=1 Tax=Chitinophaga chungangae TaxID=2821488 RepID=A0ABS3Y8Q3_9BACT|nr:polysaccharide deacetylase family protein [Chitinophaga chungangae]MBO9151062.1 polysaccharide deacetylase family protein [Chitinophaga chungangae]